ncbi:MAG: hypothetical protein E7C78_01790, partial [Dermabacter sp.]|nr:hypothetical protein [Dermabacter sp.]
ISNSSIDAPIFTYALSHLALIARGTWLQLVVFVVWLACFVIYSRALIRERDADRAAAEAAA